MPIVQDRFKDKKETKYNKAKQYLMQIRWIDDDIKREEEEIRRLTAIAEGIKAITYDRDKVQSSGGSDKMTDAVIKIMEFKDRMTADSLRLIELRTTIRQQIAELPDPVHKQILFRYYFDAQRFEKIAADLGYSYQYIINAHGRALQAFEKQHMNNLP